MTGPNMLKTINLKADILLVEDVQSEVILTRISLDNANLPYGLTILKQGRETVPYLTDGTKPLPDLLVLDMMLPDMDGFEILAEMAKHPALHHLPIIVLSGRSDLADLQSKYTLNILGCLKKPLDPDAMRTILVRLKPREA